MLTTLINQERELLSKEYELQIQTIEQQLEDGGIGNMNWLRERLDGLSPKNIKEYILYPFRQELEPEIVFYPTSKGKPYRFNKGKMNRWLMENFERIEWD